MNTEVGPHDLASAALILTPSGDAITKPLSDTFFMELDEDFENFKGHLHEVE